MVGDLRKDIRASAHHHNMRAFPRQSRGDGSTDARSSARDQDALACETLDPATLPGTTELVKCSVCSLGSMEERSPR